MLLEWSEMLNTHNRENDTVDMYFILHTCIDILTLIDLAHQFFENLYLGILMHARILCTV